MKNPSDYYDQVFVSMLDSMAKSRIEKDKWSDAEEETSGTQVFKIGESLRPFYLYALHNPDEPLRLKPDILQADTEFFFNTIHKFGFFPSPYSAVESTDQYTDFAAFTLEFAHVFHQWARSSSTARGWKSLKLAEESARQAFDFLCEPRNRLEDDKYVRWAGTTTHTRSGKAGLLEVFTDTYFTSVVVLALALAVESPVLPLRRGEKDKAIALITKAGSWIANRSDRNLLTGDEKRTIRKLLYTTWGLRALARTYDYQEPSVRQIFRSVVPEYLTTLDSIVRQSPISITQDYLSVCSTELDTQLAYEDRSSWGGVLLSLLDLSRITEIESSLEECSYSRILDNVLNGVLALRDTASDLWYKDFPILSIHSYLAECFLLLRKENKALGYSFEVSSPLVARTIKETIEDSRVVKVIQQVFYEKLEHNARRKTQGQKITSELDVLRPSSRIKDQQ